MTMKQMIDLSGSPVRIRSGVDEQGGLFSVKDGRIRGWYHAPTTDSEITLLLDGECYQRSVANQPLLSIVNDKKTETEIAFEFTLSELTRQRVNRFHVVNERSGYNFNNVELCFCPLVNKHRALLKKLFIAEFYRHRYGFSAMSNREAFNHFINVGIYDDLDPNPWFSTDYYRASYSHKLETIEIPILSYIQFEKDLNVQPSVDFVPEYYHRENSDLHGADLLLAHYVEYGHKEGRYPSDRQLPSSLYDEIDMLGQIEPLLQDFRVRERRVEQYPRITRSMYLSDTLKKQHGSKYVAVVCVPFLSCGGAELISLFLLNAYQRAFGHDRVLLLVTDRAENTVAKWVDRRTEVIFLDDEAQFDNFDEKVAVLHQIIGSLCPDIVLNVNSHACWEMYSRYAKQLSTAARLFAYLFCFDYSADRRRVGYIRDYLPETLPFLDKVLFDNKQIVNDVIDLYGFADCQSEKLQTVYVPIPKTMSCKLSHDENRKMTRRILWVGRLARQKRPELLVKIASAMPDYTFDVFGPTGDSNVCKSIVNNTYDNINYSGVFNSPSELDLGGYDLYLNTSEWEGLPTILIQLMGLGIPVVTSNAGGISELVTENTGWIVENDDDPLSYVSCIKTVLISQEIARTRSIRGVELVKRRHCWQAFYRGLERQLLFDRQHVESEEVCTDLQSTDTLSDFTILKDVKQAPAVDTTTSVEQPVRVRTKGISLSKSKDATTASDNCDTDEPFELKSVSDALLPINIG